MMDLVLRLREARRMSGLTQGEAAQLSGVGEKTLSSFESGNRIDSMKVRQLRKLLKAYRISESDFFSQDFEKRALATITPLRVESKGRAL